MTIEEYDNKKELRKIIESYDSAIETIKREDCFMIASGLFLSIVSDGDVIQKIIQILEEKKQQLIDEFEK